MRFFHNKHTHYNEVRAGVCLLGLLAVPLLSGCGGGGGGNGNTGGTTTTGTTSTGTTNSGTNSGVQNPLSVSGVTVTGLTATLSEPAGTISVGSTVTYTLTLTNTTGTAITIRSATPTPVAPSASLTVTGPTGVQPPLPPTPPLLNASLAAGQSISTTITANGFTAAGTYSATATFGDDNSGTPKSIGPLTVIVQ